MIQPAPKLTVPPHWDGAAPVTLSPAGRVSVKPSPVCCGLPAPLAMVKPSVVPVPAAMVAAPNALVSTAWLLTARVAAAPEMSRLPAAALRLPLAALFR